jgi:DNA-binding response OmpR family regulator
MRILIVDDCEMSAGMLAVVLEIYGHEVRLTRNHGAAVRVATDFQPQMVLLTVTAPMTAIESDVAERLREAADVEPQIFALCSTPGELSSHERSAFDRVFPRPVRFGQLKPFLDSSLRSSCIFDERVHSA